MQMEKEFFKIINKECTGTAKQQNREMPMLRII